MKSATTPSLTEMLLSPGLMLISPQMELPKLKLSITSGTTWLKPRTSPPLNHIMFRHLLAVYKLRIFHSTASHSRWNILSSLKSKNSSARASTSIPAILVPTSHTSKPASQAIRLSPDSANLISCSDIPPPRRRLRRICAQRHFSIKSSA